MKDFFRDIENFFGDLEDSIENIFDKSKNMVNINGKSFEGRNVIVTNNKVIIDGVDVTPESKTINITVDANIDKLDVDVCDKVIVNGNVNELATASGDVDCKDVTGSVRTVSGDIECGNVGGDVSTTSGDVKAENIAGNVKTLSGDIKYKK
jgi:hypothetical protein